MKFSSFCNLKRNSAESMLDQSNHLSKEVGTHESFQHRAPSLNGRSPYTSSLLGEYTRILLLLVSIPLLIWLIQLVTRDNVSPIPLVAAGILVASLLTERGLNGVRACLLVAMTLNVFSSVINPNAFFLKPDTYNPLTIPNVILVFCLATASFFELASVCRGNRRPTWMKLASLGFVVIPAIIYVIGIPVATLWWEAFGDGTGRGNARDPNWTMDKEMAFRAAKFSVFVVFTYLGACVGSFLNVVAYCIPRGEAVGLRNSYCPVCKSKISRKDNLPIFSYINLSARCRSCQAVISPRYLVVELLIASIFGSLFLFELVTGAANVPGVHSMSHAGVLWVVLFPKFNLIGLYFYHCLFASALVVLALIEWDGQTLGYRHSITMLLVFLISATFFQPLQPIPAPEFFLAWFGEVSLFAQLGKLVLGGVCGAGLGLLVNVIRGESNSSTLFPAMILCGIVLGWQSLVYVTLIFVVLQVLIRYLPKLGRFSSACPTGLLLLAVGIHHPFWKYLLQQISV